MAERIVSTSFVPEHIDFVANSNFVKSKTCTLPTIIMSSSFQVNNIYFGNKPSKTGNTTGFATSTYDIPVNNYDDSFYVYCDQSKPSKSFAFDNTVYETTDEAYITFTESNGEETESNGGDSQDFEMSDEAYISATESNGEETGSNGDSQDFEMSDEAYISVTETNGDETDANKTIDFEMSDEAYISVTETNAESDGEETNAEESNGEETDGEETDAESVDSQSIYFDTTVYESITTGESWPVPAPIAPEFPIETLDGDCIIAPGAQTLDEIECNEALAVEENVQHSKEWVLDVLRRRATVLHLEAFFDPSKEQLCDWTIFKVALDLVLTSDDGYVTCAEYLKYFSMVLDVDTVVCFMLHYKNYNTTPNSSALLQHLARVLQNPRLAIIHEEEEMLRELFDGLSNGSIDIVEANTLLNRESVVDLTRL